MAGGELLVRRGVGVPQRRFAAHLRRADPAAYRPHGVPHHAAARSCRPQSDAVGRASCIIIAFGLMPLAGAVAINFSAPLFATLVAALWLHEKVGLARGIALVVGFLGVLLVAAPGADSFRMGALFAIANAVLYGSVTAIVRGMSKTEVGRNADHVPDGLASRCSSALALPFAGFTWPTGMDFAALALNGILNGFGQYWWTRSLSLAPPSAVGPFYYFSLVWALILGFMFWGDVPGLALIAGSAIVVGSGLYLLWHESGKKPLPPEEPL